MHQVLSKSEAIDQFIDHRNLIFLFDSLPVVPDLSFSAVWKTFQWAVCLGTYTYIHVYTKTLNNAWTDTLVCVSLSALAPRLVNIYLFLRLFIR